MPARKPRPPRALVPRQYSRLAHGLRAAAVVIPGAESEHDWRRFEAHIMRSLGPVGAIEVALAARVAESLWRLDRVARAERACVAGQRQLGEEDPQPLTEGEKRALGFYLPAVLESEARARESYRGALLPAPEDLDRLLRYEAHLTRQFYQALHELEARQARRRGEPAPLARLDVQSPHDA